jgi:hypothetical protein
MKIFSSEDSGKYSVDLGEVWMKNITFIDSLNFLHILSCLGSVEIFLFIIDYLTFYNNLEFVSYEKVIIKILAVLEKLIIMELKNGQGEIMKFFGSKGNGLQILMHLFVELFKNKEAQIKELSTTEQDEKQQKLR